MTGDPVRRVLISQPVYAGEPNVMSGFQVLHEQQLKYTERAIRELPEAVKGWYQYLSLFDRMLRRSYESPERVGSDEHVAWNLRVLMGVTAAGTAKLTLDALLAGYYTQAAALNRHMLETWKVQAYARLNPAGARQWFSPDGERDAVPPSMAAITRIIRKQAKCQKDLDTVANIEGVERRIAYLNDGSHPSPMAVAQPRTDDPGFSLLGPQFKREWFRSGMNNGLVVVGLVLAETSKAFPADVNCREELKEIWAALAEVWPVGDGGHG